MNSRISLLMTLAAVTSIFASVDHRAAAQTSIPSTNTAGEILPGPLRIHVTATQGGAQYRSDPAAKWQSVTSGLDLTQGTEFRTGPKGTIQFTVGTDQVFRVDRLTVVKVLRAALLPDGTLQTDVGMTYGRVSKDVDLPQRVHLDSIISPSSTISVRGTRISLYDQPPYPVEAVSLTGAANFQHLFGPPVHLGGKETGKAKLADNSPGSGQYQIQSNLIDPNGFFSGLTGPEQQILLTEPGGLGRTPVNIFHGGGSAPFGEGTHPKGLGPF